MELVGIIQQGGSVALTAVLGFLYWAERAERRELQDKLHKMLEQSILATESTRNALAALTAILTAGGKGQ